MRRAVSLLIHGDAVPVLRVGKPGTNSLDCLSFQSLLGRGPPLSIKFLMFCIFEKTKLKNIPGVTDTMEQVWGILMHSFGALFEGKFSKTTHDGEPVSGAKAVIADNWLCSEEEGFFGVIWSITGDLDWYAKELGLNNYNSKLSCPYCPVGTKKIKALWPINFSRSAEWPDKVHSAEQWREFGKGASHPRFAYFVFLSTLNVECDELHIW